MGISSKQEVMQQWSMVVLQKWNFGQIKLSDGVLKLSMSMNQTYIIQLLPTKNTLMLLLSRDTATLIPLSTWLHLLFVTLSKGIKQTIVPFVLLLYDMPVTTKPV